MVRRLRIALAALSAAALLSSCAWVAGRALRLRGESLLRSGDYSGAADCFERLIEIEPGNARAFTGFAEACAAAGDWDRAAEMLERGLELLPGNQELTSMLQQARVCSTLNRLPVFLMADGSESTEIVLFADGTFRGEYGDFRADETGPDYPGGTRRECRFYGTLSDISFISDRELAAFVAGVQTYDAQEYIKDGVRAVPCAADAIGSGDILHVYLPETSLTALPREYAGAVLSDISKPWLKTLPFSGLYLEPRGASYVSAQSVKFADRSEELVGQLGDESLPPGEADGALLDWLANEYLTEDGFLLDIVLENGQWFLAAHGEGGLLQSRAITGLSLADGMTVMFALADAAGEKTQIPVDLSRFFSDGVLVIDGRQALWNALPHVS